MKNLILIILTAITFTSCSKKNADLEPSAISDYSSLTIGKYITYEADSMLFTNFGANEIHKYYQFKHLVIDTFRDNNSQLYFKIQRYSRNIPSAGGLPSTNFVADSIFYATNTANSLEYIENNKRFVKLKTPLQNNFSWKGNLFINLNAPYYNIFFNSNFLDDWDYVYENVESQSPINIPGFNLSNTITVKQKNYSENLPVNNNTFLAQLVSGKEIYAKDIGMVYREFICWEYQAFTKYIGFGVKMKMIDKN